MPGDSDEVTDVLVVATTAADMPRDTSKVTDESVAATTYTKVTNMINIAVQSTNIMAGWDNGSGKYQLQQLRTDLEKHLEKPLKKGDNC